MSRVTAEHRYTRHDHIYMYFRHELLQCRLVWTFCLHKYRVPAPKVTPCSLVAPPTLWSDMLLEFVSENKWSLGCYSVYIGTHSDVCIKHAAFSTRVQQGASSGERNHEEGGSIFFRNTDDCLPNCRRGSSRSTKPPGHWVSFPGK